MAYDLQILEKGCEELGITLNSQQKIQFIKYYELLVERNKMMNLTAITDFEEVLRKHFVDSLAIVKAVDVDKVTTMIDVGTGAGFPGIPLKIAFPHLQVCLMDSLQKRIVFLEEVLSRIGVKEIMGVHGRAEDFGKKTGYRENYDLCVSRAVANLSSLSEYCLPFVKVGGTFVSYKSGKVQEEVVQAEHAVKTLGGEMMEPVYLRLPDSDIERSFIIIKKKMPTPKDYPRKAGTPAKNPL